MFKWVSVIHRGHGSNVSHLNVCQRHIRDVFECLFFFVWQSLEVTNSFLSEISMPWAMEKMHVSIPLGMKRGVRWIIFFVLKRLS